MSDFFLIPREPRLARVGMTTLARLSHWADDTGDDVLLLQVQDEIESRWPHPGGIFRDEYVRLLREDRKTRRAELTRVGWFPASNRKEAARG